jgi:hypothetical protein
MLQIMALSLQQQQQQQQQHHQPQRAGRLARETGPMSPAVEDAVSSPTSKPGGGELGSVASKADSHASTEVGRVET